MTVVPCILRGSVRWDYGQERPGVSDCTAVPDRWGEELPKGWVHGRDEGGWVP